MTVCYLSRSYRDRLSAGNKAKTDMEILMEHWGFRNLGLPQSFHRQKILTFALNLVGVDKCCMSLRRGDVLILQYPVKKYFTLLCQSARLHGAKVVALIHDLGSFRRKKLSPEREIGRLNHADYIIAANPSMREWLIIHGCNVPIGIQGIWDYLGNDTSNLSSPLHILRKRALPESRFSITYAGQLCSRKNSFLCQLGDCLTNTDIHLYGSGFHTSEAHHSERLVYHGFVNSDTLIDHIEGDFGLVWDGDSVDSCSGSFGEYLAYNNPHKASLYISCGLPLIIWRGAALAPFIEHEGIGFAVESLRDIEERLSGLSPDDYNLMLDNVARIRKATSSGHFFRTALDQAFLRLNA